jgi:hypothetical protein
MKIVFLFGEICSGKSTLDFGESSTRITVSNIVKRLMQSEDREVLQKSKHLDKVIADEIIEEIDHIFGYVYPHPQTIIVDGIRQYSILQLLEQYLQKEFPDLPIEYKWLEVDSTERKRRFEARKDPKDTLTFEEAEKRDNELGLSQLFSILKEQNKI